MKLMIIGKNLEVGNSLRVHIEEKLTQAVQHYVADAVEGGATLTKEKHLFCSEVFVHVSHNFVVRANGEDEDPYRSIDLATAKLEAQMKRYRGRLRDRHRGGGQEGHVPAQYYVLEGHTEEEVGDNPLIIAEMESEVLNLSVSEAVMRMDLSASPVIMFRNNTNGQLNVVYRRDDGNIGWINPETGV
ncbi:MAG: ribosome-associated translation inhibitor RaiA [Alphaproteobacteria bacterium]